MDQPYFQQGGMVSREGAESPIAGKAANLGPQTKGWFSMMCSGKDSGATNTLLRTDLLLCLFSLSCLPSFLPCFLACLPFFFDSVPPSLPSVVRSSFFVPFFFLYFSFLFSFFLLPSQSLPPPLHGLVFLVVQDFLASLSLLAGPCELKVCFLAVAFLRRLLQEDRLSRGTSPVQAQTVRDMSSFPKSAEDISSPARARQSWRRCNADSSCGFICPLSYDPDLIKAPAAVVRTSVLRHHTVIASGCCVSTPLKGNEHRIMF